MAYEENLAEIRAQGYHYLVASRQAERHAEPVHKEIYATLNIPTEVMKPVRTWHESPW